MSFNLSQSLRRRSTLALSIALAAVLLMIAALVVQQGLSQASSHREAPLISQDQFADNTDTYAFVSPTNPENVVLVASWIPLEAPEGGPNYYEWGKGVTYNINVDSDGDAVADYTYSLTGEAEVQNPLTFLYSLGNITADLSNWNRQQRITITETSADGQATLLDNVLTAPVNIGNKSTPNYEELEDDFIYEVNDGGDDLTIYAGQTDDAFWVDLQVFDLLTLRGQPAPIGYETGNNIPVDSLSGFNNHSIVIELPISRITNEGEPVIGVWATAERSSMRVRTPGAIAEEGDKVQVSRLGMPLVNEAVLPYALKDAFNSLMPSQDLTVYTDPTLGPILQESVEDPELGNLLCGLYGVPLPADSDGDCSTEVEIGTPRSGRGDIFDIFLTGMVLASDFTINTAGGPVTLPAGFNVNRPENVVPAEMIRLNTAISGDLCAPVPSRLGVLGGDACGFPNGRRLLDDVVDIELLAVAGAAYNVLDGREEFTFNADLIGVLDDGLNGNDVAFRDTFPYMSLAQSGQSHIHENPFTPGDQMDDGTMAQVSRVLDFTEDAEELPDGTVLAFSRDLDLGENNGTPQTVGVYFDNVQVPAGATVTGAYLQFEASSVNTGPASFAIQGVVGNDVEDFDRNNRQFANRPMTNASADWTDVEPWEAVGEKHWSANFGNVAAEIVAGAGWESGDAMVLTITGTGTREAYSYDGKKSGAPLLYVEYTTADGDGVTSASTGRMNAASSVVSSSVLDDSNLDTTETPADVPDEDEMYFEGEVAPEQTQGSIFLPLVTDQ